MSIYEWMANAAYKDLYILVKAGEDLPEEGTELVVDEDNFVASIGNGGYVTCAANIPAGSVFHAKRVRSE